MKSVDNKRPLKVFLCHAHADRDPVRGLYSRLTQDGVDAWLDKAKLLPGQDWELEIRKAVREADVVVVCLSKQFNQAGFRQKEVRLALDTAMEQPEGEIFIIPARLEECDNLESLRRWHWVDLFEDDGYEMLMRALRTRANKIDATLQINSVARENKQREAAEKVERERVAKEAREKREREAAEKETKEKAEKNFQREVDNRLKKIKRELQLESYRTKIHHWLARVRIYALPNILFTLGAIFAISMAVYYSKNIPILSQILNVTPQATPENTQTQAKDTLPQNTDEPSATSAPELTSIPSEKQTPTSLPTEITDAKGVSMMLVPTGEFTMGSDDGKDDEKPVRQVYLDAFYMDVYEVTNAAYKVCVDDGNCSPPKQTNSHSRSTYYGNSTYNDYPVIYVDWNQANAYCSWRDGGLPTEEQWEKAARGTDNRIYPWGSGIDCSRANFRDCIGDTSEIGRYEIGKSPYGIYDLEGNVSEWVIDWYDANLGNTIENANYGTKYRVVRGGSWFSAFWYGVNSLRVSYRDNKSPYDIANDIGFRCVMEIP